MFGEQTLLALFTVYLILVLIFCSLTDLRNLTIPNTFSLASLIGALAYASVSSQAACFHILGGGIGFTSFVALSFAFKHIRHYEGLGLGDAKFMAGAGTWVGWQGLPLLILIASLSALLYVAACRLLTGQYNRMARLPFAPFLSLGTLIVWFLEMSGGVQWLL